MRHERDVRGLFPTTLEPHTLPTFVWSSYMSPTRNCSSMEHFISRALVQLAPRARSSVIRTARSQFHKPRIPSQTSSRLCLRTYATNPPRAKDDPPDHSDVVYESSYAQPAHDFSQEVTPAEKDHYDRIVEHSKQQQVRSPWTRADSDVPPVARQRSAGAMVKGR